MKNQDEFLDKKIPSRVVIENVCPEIDGGKFAAKAIRGDRLTVQADIFAEGHDLLSASLLYRKEGEKRWQTSSMKLIENDRWSGCFLLEELGFYEYTFQGWGDPFKTWLDGVKKKVDAQSLVPIDFEIGIDLLRRRIASSQKKALQEWIEKLQSVSFPEDQLRIVCGEQFIEFVERHQKPASLTQYPRVLKVEVDRLRARFGSWYEFFPRSSSPDLHRPGTFQDCIAKLPAIQQMGFDVVYLPPIHPIGKIYRKGKNNTLQAGPEDPGSPWAIGSSEGGHDAIHPDLGTPEDLQELIEEARKRDLEIALDLAFQCAPDHPWVSSHPEWFKKRPNGTIQYAENPPKKYQDIYPFDFECKAWPSLWEELKRVVLFWIGQGIRIFRVDNPHTKPFPFWEWLIRSVKQEFPETIFLAEAFTRPKPMAYLAKIGFSQSYTYFAWKNSASELRDYFTELAQSPLKDFFRPNVWTNTPDILSEYLQSGGRPAFIIRLILAATLSANYGVYGPPFELCENVPLKLGSEEYLNSEKYEVRIWNEEASHSLKGLIGQVNRIRREHRALQSNESLRFHPTTNEKILCYSKHRSDLSEILLIVVNLDPHYAQSGFVELPLSSFRIDPQETYQVHDLLTEARYFWSGPKNYVELHPHLFPAHLFYLRRQVRTEKDFNYFG